MSDVLDIVQPYLQTISSGRNPENDLLSSANENENHYMNGYEGAKSSSLPLHERARGAWRTGAGENEQEFIGRISAPRGHEATSGSFHALFADEIAVEATQIVTVHSRLPGTSTDVMYYALVDEVYRRGGCDSFEEERDGCDGILGEEPPFVSEGITYAECSILRAEPNVLAPPRERSPVALANGIQAAKAYGVDDIGNERNRLPFGLITNGSATSGAGCLDLAYLLGENGGHLNVSGAAGQATKSSFLLHIVYLLLEKARREQQAFPSDGERLQVVPIIFNVKNYDLFHIDKASNRYGKPLALKPLRPS